MAALSWVNSAPTFYRNRPCVRKQKAVHLRGALENGVAMFCHLPEKLILAKTGQRLARGQDHWEHVGWAQKQRVSTSRRWKTVSNHRHTADSKGTYQCQYKLKGRRSQEWWLRQENWYVVLPPFPFQQQQTRAQGLVWIMRENQVWKSEWKRPTKAHREWVTLLGSVSLGMGFGVPEAQARPSGSLISCCLLIEM